MSTVFSGTFWSVSLKQEATLRNHRFNRHTFYPLINKTFIVEEKIISDVKKCFLSLHTKLFMELRNNYCRPFLLVHDNVLQDFEGLNSGKLSNLLV